jgi:Spy/CpxP family protein refolding chaperone
MSEPTATSQHPAPSTGTPRRRFFQRAAIATAIAALATGIGLRAAAHGHGFGGCHRGGFMGAQLDPATLDEHLDRMLNHLYVEVDATAAQKQQIAPIVKAAVRDLLPIRDQMRDGRRQAVALLSQPSVDRAALEALRVEQLQHAEVASRRFAEALATSPMRSRPRSGRSSPSGSAAGSATPGRLHGWGRTSS